ncbi:MAG: HEAT repeat domain-containing protein [Deltaproteobacteria bacterium]|nr:HEAT repeat domain-containing protein [Deltaproteobacteria bacterium]
MTVPYFPLEETAMTSGERDERTRLAAIRAWRERYDADAAGLIRDLRDAGFNISSVENLYNGKLHYDSAIPILVTWLRRIINPIVKEDIVRALSVKWAEQTEAPKLLVSEFEKNEDSTGEGLGWTIGNALEVLANDEIAEDMVRLARDRSHGAAREMIVMGLGKLKNNRSVVDTLIALLDDEEVAGHAVIALGKLQAKSARSHLDHFLSHPKTWVRNAAKKAVARIDKAQ